MAVSIPISADPSPLINATQRAEVYVNRLRQRLADVGKIKLTDGIDELRRDAETVGKNLHDLLDPRRSALGGRVRAAGLHDASIEDIEQQWHRIHPNATPNERARMLRRFQRNLLASTSYEATAGSEEHTSPQPPPSAPAPSPSRSPAIPGLTTLKAGGTFALGLAGVQTGLEAVTSAYKGAHEWSRATDEFMRRTQDTGEDFAYLKQQIGSLGKAIGMTSDESARLTLAFTRAAQAKDLEQATAGARTAIGLAAGFGADRDQTVQQMARLQLIGASGPLSTNQKTFALEIARTVGQHNIPLEKGLADFARLAEASAARTGNAPPTETITGFLSALYDVAEKRPGLKGQSGVALLTQADEGLRTTEDPATLMMLYHGMSKLMGTTNFMDVLVQQQRGGLAPIMRKQRDARGKEVEVDTGKTTFDVLVEETGRMYGADPRVHARAVGERIGDPHSIERIMAMIEISRQRQGKGNGGIGAYLQDLKRRGVDPEKLDDTAYKDLGDILKHTDAGAQFQAATAKYDKGYTPTLPFSDEETKRLHELRAKATNGGADAQKEFTDFFVRMIGEHGGQQTPYTQMEVTLGQIRETLLQKVGQPIETGFAEVAALLQKGFGITPEQAAATENYAKAQKTARSTAQDANDALAAAQAAVDQAPPGSPEHLKALGNLQKVYQQQQPRVQQAQQEKQAIWRKQSGWPFDNTDWSGQILEWLGVIGPDQSPAEAKAQQTLDQSPMERRRIQLIREAQAGTRYGQGRDPAKIQQDLAETEQALKTPAPLPETNPSIRPRVEPERRAQGGPIGGGYGGGDRVPALLEAGEFVINKVDSQKHRSLLEQINRGAVAPVRRAQGGPTDSTIWFSPPPAAGVPSLDAPSDEGAAAAVQDLQKRLDQLFDPVTRYLGEMAAALRALTGAGTPTPGKAAPPSGAVSTATSAPLANGPGTGATPTGAAGFALDGRSNRRLPGDGLGFLSPGAPWFSPERRPDFVGPPAALAGDAAPHRPQRAGATDASALPTTAKGAATASPSARQVRTGTPDGVRTLLNTISRGEGTSDAAAQRHGYASGYDVTLGFGRYGGAPGSGKPLSEMTLGEVRQLQKQMLAHPDNKLNSSAVGKYQIVGRTLFGKDGTSGLYKELGLKDSDTFSPELQDRLGQKLLERRGLKKFQQGQMNATQFQSNLAYEWASIAHPGTGRATQHTGTSTTDIQAAMRAAQSPSAADPAYTPRPGEWVEPYQSRRDLPPLDAPPRAEDSRAAPPAAGMGMGQLEVLIRQQDAYGARIGQDVAHVLDLRTPRPYGAVSVDRLNSARTA